MTEPVNDNDIDKAAVPLAVQAPRWHWSPWLIWLVPLVAALVGGTILVQALLERGPSITINFKSAEGLEAGKTKIKYKDVDIGTVGRITLSPDRKQALDTLVTAMRSAWTRADRSAMGVQAIDAFRLLQEAMPRGPKAIPVQVDQLDYAGFKVKALLSSSSVDWAQVSNTVREASTWWSSIEVRTADVTLKDAMNRTILGMKAAADQKDPKLMNFAADMELILVDGLETFFTAHPRSH